MSLWNKLQSLPEEGQRAVHNLYGEHFPIVVRSVLGQWIEEKPWAELDLENPQHEQYARGLIASLLQEIQVRASLEENFLFKVQLAEFVKFFHSQYATNELYLFNIVKNCLIQERKIIDEFSQTYHNLEDHRDRKMPADQEISQQIEILRRQTLETETDLKSMQQEQECFKIHYQEFTKLNSVLVHSRNSQNASVEVINKLQRDKDAADNALRQRASGLINTRIRWLEKHHNTFTALSALQSRVLDQELIRWKRAQQLSGNGALFDNNLDRIQEWCEGLAELTWSNRVQLDAMESLCNNLPFPAHSQAERIEVFKQQITSSLSCLVTSTFVIEKQPPQVMKTNTRFGATVRLLVGGKLNLHMTPPNIRVSIISEQQANNLLKTDQTIMDDSSGEILNNTGTMEYHGATKQLSVNFRNMQLRKIKRAEKKGTESVMDEKFSLYFQSKFKVAGGELVFQVWTLSLPVVVIVHGNQEPHAWATVTWDNAFAETGRVPFVVPEKVPWQRVAEVLNMKFKAAVGRDLTPESLRFLAGKAFREISGKNPSLQDYDNLALSWGQFSKEPLPDRSFTFWEWFYAILKVTKDHLRQLWADGLIMGFVGRKQAEDMLLQRPPGTFLLRYSDSELGGVTIAWHAENQDRPEVFMVQPFTSRDFQIRGLPDRINDIKHLTYLFPDIPKDQAFMKYYTPVNENQPKPNGYIQPVLVTHIPWWAGGSSMDSYPNTPQSGILHNPQSPSDGSMSHDNPASVRSNSNDVTMNVGDRMLPQMDYRDLMLSMDLPSDMDDPIDYSDISDINVSDLMNFGKQS